MVMPTTFFKPWSEVDPTLAHGGIPDVIGEGFVAPDLGDNPTTLNADLLRIFAAVRDTATAISMEPSADVEGPPLRNIVEEVLRGYNFIAERIIDRTRGDATAIFQWTHAVPPRTVYRVRPIHFPLRNDFANDAVFFLIGMMVEVAEANANGLHSCLDPSSSARILAPLHHVKANIARDWFDKEVAGEITLDEITTLYAKVGAPPGPTIVPPSETAPVPGSSDVAEVMTGVEILQWYPTEADWTKFGQKRSALYKPERIWQPEGALSVTEDISPETPVATPTIPTSPG